MKDKKKSSVYERVFGGPTMTRRQVEEFTSKAQANVDKARSTILKRRWWQIFSPKVRLNDHVEIVVKLQEQIVDLLRRKDQDNYLASVQLLENERDSLCASLARRDEEFDKVAVRYEELVTLNRKAAETLRSFMSTAPMQTVHGFMDAKSIVHASEDGEEFDLLGCLVAIYDAGVNKALQAEQAISETDEEIDGAPE